MNLSPKRRAHCGHALVAPMPEQGEWCHAWKRRLPSNTSVSNHAKVDDRWASSVLEAALRKPQATTAGEEVLTHSGIEPAHNDS